MKNVKSGHVRPIVCLDAGHYGKYNRSPVVKDYYESDMTWKLTNYQKAELEKYGIEVILTRADKDKDLGLVARGKLSQGADLFLSNHSNACDTESVDRPVGIYLVDDNCGCIDEQSKAVAGLLAEITQEVMQTKGKAQLFTMVASGDRDRDGKKNDDYYSVLYGAHQVGTAGVIIEHSFHTNARAAKWLLVDANLQALAKAEAKVIATWFGLDEADVSEPEKPQEKPVEVPESKPAAITKGTKVRFKASATTYYPGGSRIPSFVRPYHHIVTQTEVNGKPVTKGGKTCVLLGKKVHEAGGEVEPGINTWVAVDNLEVV